jgi:hypothetical protein
VLTQPQGRFSESGFLGERHCPYATGGDPVQAQALRSLDQAGQQA